MKEEIKVPTMGESINEAIISSILKAPGSKVQLDEELLELATDKVNQILYAPQDGVFTPTVAEGDTVTIGQVIGYIDTSAAAEEKEAVSTGEEKAGAQGAEEGERSKETPKASRHGAKDSAEAAAKAPERKVEVTAAGDARIDKLAFMRDEEKAPPEVTAPAPDPIPSAPPAPPKGGDGARRETRRKMSPIRKVIAQRLVQVQSSAAMLTTFNEVDLTAVMALREKYRESFEKKHGVRLGLMSFFVTAVVAALRKFPQLNSYIDGDEIVEREYYDIGIAVGSEKGLVVPVIRRCDRLSFAQIEKAIGEYSAKAKGGTLTVDDLTGAGFTISNGGIFGSLLSTPILAPQQCGILGMHKIAKRPMVVDDAIVIRQMMYLALSYDHRIIDGKEAVSFLVEIKNILEEPARQLFNL